MRLLCRRTTPLGLAVVPDVYTSVAGDLEYSSILLREQDEDHVDRME